MTRFKRDARVYLQDILSAVRRVEEYAANGPDCFFADGLLQDGVIRQLSIVGEAAAKLSTALKAQHPEIPWKKIIGMRNIIIHDYSEINLQRVWDTVERDLPALKKTVEAMLKRQAA